MKLDKQALDNWIMGINDPNAPFNQDDEEEMICPKCKYKGGEDEFDFEDDDRIYCPECKAVVYEES